MSHWLTSVVRSAGLENADMLDLPADLADMAAWDTTCSVCGIAADQLADTVAAAFRIEVASLPEAEPTATKLLPANIAKKFGVFPVRDMDRFLVVATSNPTDVLAEQEVGFACGRIPTFVVADPWAISLVIEGAYSAELATAALLSDREGDSGYLDDVLVEMMGDEVLRRSRKRTRRLHPSYVWPTSFFRRPSPAARPISTSSRTQPAVSCASARMAYCTRECRCLHRC